MHHIPTQLKLVWVYLDTLSLRGYCFSSIGNLGDLAVSFSTLSDTFDCSLVIFGTDSLEDSLCEICGKLVSGNSISVSGTLSLWELTLCSNNWFLWCHSWSETWTLYDTGPVCSTMVPGIHFALSLRFLTKTDCPISNSRYLVWASW